MAICGRRADPGCQSGRNCCGAGRQRRRDAQALLSGGQAKDSLAAGEFGYGSSHRPGSRREDSGTRCGGAAKILSESPCERQPTKPRLQEEEMMKENGESPASEESAGDVLHAITRIALSSIPAVGAPRLNYLTFSFLLHWKSEGKKWAASVNKRLGEVEADVAALVEDQSFGFDGPASQQYCNPHSSRGKTGGLAQRSRQFSDWRGSGDDMRSFFLNLVDTFTPNTSADSQVFPKSLDFGHFRFQSSERQGTVADQMVFQTCSTGTYSRSSPICSQK